MGAKKQIKKLSKERAAVSRLLENIEEEGLTDALYCISDYESIKDKDFHKLKDEYLETLDMLWIKIFQLQNRHKL